MLLSIIIPCYNSGPYINELLDCLTPQVTKEVEVIVIDDGSKKPFKTGHKWAKVIRQKNGGASSARNKGLNTATGDYIAFIDSDDLVSDKYVETILNKIRTEKFDYLYMSWRAFGAWSYNVLLRDVKDKFPPFNLCVWNRVYKRSMIGKVRFNTKKAVAEDAEFIRKVKEQGKKSFIPEVMYYYRSDTPQSLTKRVSSGIVPMKRIVYNFPRVTSDMIYLLEEFKAADKDSEVILMTEKNDIPELEQYAMIIPPQRMKGTELRGVKTSLFEKIHQPIKTEIVIYTSKTYKIGGIETFIFEFCRSMSQYYDICVLYDFIDLEQLCRLSAFATVRKNDLKIPIVCDTLIINRVIDEAPENVSYKQRVQMCHALKTGKHQYKLPAADKVVYVSDLARRSFDDPEGIVIHNLLAPEEVNPALILVTCSRLQSGEKGYDRMIRLAGALNDRRIPFKWLVFSDKPIEGVENVISMKPLIDVKPWIKAASYLVQLSDEESYGYSIVEALALGVPVLTTPVDVLPELGVVDGVNGYILPFEGDYVEIVEKIYKSPIKGLQYSFDNAAVVEQWRDLLGRHRKKTRAEVVQVKVLQPYRDVTLGRDTEKGMILYMQKDRAAEAVKRNLVEYVI